MTLQAELLEMMTYCRPAGTETERLFIERWIQPLPGAYVDRHGNWHVPVGDDPKILWSAHTDTVHRAPGRQTVHYNTHTGLASLSRRSLSDRRNCLGADNSAGVFVLVNMIRRHVPGWYVFHYGEERGGIGSRAVTRSDPEWASRFTHAIAFDRRGTADIITEQWSGRTASDAFAIGLADQLSGHGLTYAPSPHGSFTDTAEYADHVPECSNLAIGFAREHTRDESLDVPHVLRLLDAMSGIDPSTLIVERTPGDYGDRSSRYLSWDLLSDEELVRKDTHDRDLLPVWYRGQSAYQKAAQTYREYLQRGRVLDPTYARVIDDEEEITDLMKFCPFHNVNEDCECDDYDHGPWDLADADDPTVLSDRMYLDRTFGRVQRSLKGDK